MINGSWVSHGKDDADYAVLGLPGEAANGSMFVVERCFGIFSSSGSKDAARQFPLSFMSGEAQEAAADVPAIQSVFERRTEKMAQGSGEHSGADKLLALVASTTCVEDKGALLEGIIEVEARFFFEGTHTVQETVERIQQQAASLLTELARQ